MGKLDLGRVDKDWFEKPEYAAERMIFDNAGMVVCLCTAMLVKNPICKGLLGTAGMVLAIRFNHNMAEALEDLQETVHQIH